MIRRDILRSSRVDDIPISGAGRGREAVSSGHGLEPAMNDPLTKPLDSKTRIEKVEKMGAELPLKARAIQRQA